MSTVEKNIMVILSSPSGVGKTTLTKKYSKKIVILKFQFHTQQDFQDRTRLMELIIILFQKNFEELIRKKNFMSMLNF